MGYILVFFTAFFITALLFWLDGKTKKQSLLEKSKFHGKFVIDNTQLVVLPAIDYENLLYRTWKDQEALQPKLRKVLADMVRERKRQDLVHPENPESIDAMLTILIEEVGEFAQAIQREKTWSKESDCHNSYEEIVQSGAYCMRIAEYIIKRDDL